MHFNGTDEFIYRQVDGTGSAVSFQTPKDASGLLVNDTELPINQDMIAGRVGFIDNFYALSDDMAANDTLVSEEELTANHSKLPHGGFVIRSGETGNGNTEIIEYSLKLDSNPEFSSSVLIAYARACYRLASEGRFGAKTVFDVPPSYLSSLSDDEIRAKLL